jgi:hypothetical protein
MKMEVLVSSKMLVVTYQATWYHNPENHNIILQICENLESHTVIMYSLL